MPGYSISFPKLQLTRTHIIRLTPSKTPTFGASTICSVVWMQGPLASSDHANLTSSSTLGKHHHYSSMCFVYIKYETMTQKLWKYDWSQESRGKPQFPLTVASSQSLIPGDFTVVGADPVPPPQPFSSLLYPSLWSQKQGQQSYVRKIWGQNRLLGTWLIASRNRDNIGSRESLLSRGGNRRALMDGNQILYRKPTACGEMVIGHFICNSKSLLSSWHLESSWWLYWPSKSDTGERKMPWGTFLSWGEINAKITVEIGNS